MDGTIVFILVSAASFAAGFINAVAGGGSFLTFPALIAAGLPPIDANASNTVALFPGQIATTYAARDGLAKASADKRVDLPVLAAISLLGGIAGGILLLLTPEALFSRMVPWLILFATVIFAGGNFWVSDAKKFTLSRTGFFAAQGLVAIYGGYFGGGIGILMLAALTLSGLRDIWLMNSVKILLASLMNASAAVTFVIAGLVHWHWTLAVAIGAIAGGYAGLHAVRRVPAHIVKGFVVSVGLVLTIYFFLKPA
ncbi:MAG: sulfite exporter TauE/SafE family protein [Beijerinckiaceae bacterium]|nr:sulfite exporter TauE/SafE family protein [Beijerinckiaceae bacterium]